MKAIICTEPGSLVRVERPDLPPPAPGFANVAVRHVGICGTDYHIFEGKHPFLAYPRVMGHEISGIVAAVGEGVGLAPGTPVVVNPYLSCGHCVACRRGKPNCCTSIAVLGVHTHGAMTEMISLPAGNLYVAEGLSLRDAAMVEFLAIGAHAVRRSCGGKGDRALVTGIGPIGLGVALFARIAGMAVTLVDGSEERLAFARDVLGFPTVKKADSNVKATLLAENDDGFDVVFDATGNAKAIEAGFPLVAHGGTYVLVSVVKDDITFSDPEFHKREMTLMGSRNATARDFEHVVAAIRAGKVPTDALATHRTPLDAVPENLPLWAQEKSGLIKAIIDV